MKLVLFSLVLSLLTPFVSYASIITYNASLFPVVVPFLIVVGLLGWFIYKTKHPKRVVQWIFFVFFMFLFGLYLFFISRDVYGMYYVSRNFFDQYLPFYLAESEEFVEYIVFLIKVLTVVAFWGSAMPWRALIWRNTKKIVFKVFLVVFISLFFLFGIRFVVDLFGLVDQMFSFGTIHGYYEYTPPSHVLPF